MTRKERPTASREGPSVLRQALAAAGAAGCYRQLQRWSYAEQQVLLSFLCRLLQHGETTIPAEKMKLGARLQRLLDAASSRPTFRQQAVEHLLIAQDTYGRRIVRGLDDLEAKLDLEEAQAGTVPQATLALVQLSYGVMRLQVVHAHAAQYCQMMPPLDTNEVYYAFESQLRERLHLPGSSTGPIYPLVVPHQFLEVAAIAAEAVSVDKLARQVFFARWRPWQQLRRRSEAACSSYRDLPVRLRLSCDTLEQKRCPLTSKKEHDLKHPTYLGEGEAARPFEYEALIASWIADGTVPETSEPLSLKQLWRTPS